MKVRPCLIRCGNEMGNGSVLYSRRGIWEGVVMGESMAGGEFELQR